ncbi:hypothetical protein DFP72DRAFT_50056 [Ephemerocybe angulata]|uniref:Uncharacterized protein n=1 Tax=Ephemerocybe angulata TaxID=980116 RepID=A0A8H6HFU2_9AGAR|nr:hypothetical protein DFP72DRAFT_50056 [Tulosesus angulatus]
MADPGTGHTPSAPLTGVQRRTRTCPSIPPSPFASTPFERAATMRPTALLVRSGNPSIPLLRGRMYVVAVTLTLCFTRALGTGSGAVCLGSGGSKVPLAIDGVGVEEDVAGVVVSSTSITESLVDVGKGSLKDLKKVEVIGFAFAVPGRATSNGLMTLKYLPGRVGGELTPFKRAPSLTSPVLGAGSPSICFALAL